MQAQHFYMTFYDNYAVTAGLSQNISFVHDCSDHQAIHLLIECLVQVSKSVLEVLHSFGSADFNEINSYLSSNSFQTSCFTKIENASEQLCCYFHLSLIFCTTTNKALTISTTLDRSVYFKSYPKFENLIKTFDSTSQ